MRSCNILPLVVAVALGILAAGCTDVLPWAHPPAVYPAIVPVPGETVPSPPPFTFRFEDFSVTVEVPVDAAVYTGARRADKGARIFDQRIPESEWRAGIYRALMADPHQDGFFDNLLAVLRAVRESRGLDSDEYIELLSVFVQSIPYEDQQSSDPRFPIEVWVDGAGDCDDKSLLLGSLLSRENYRTALLFFEKEGHMAVGVGCSGPGYAGTGYAYVETTNVTFVGVPPGELAGGVRLTSVPLVIPVGEGTLNYTRCRETAALAAAMGEMEREIGLEKEQVRELEDALSEEKRELDAMRASLEATAPRVADAGYYSRVAAYNARVRDYNAQRSRLLALLERHNLLVDRYNTLATHQYDRKGMVAFLASLR
ncbi:MAG: hypothetical protein NQU46_01610 [Methanolinea sp.]|nr:hypothetical protein [Methanolinea sp.]